MIETIDEKKYGRLLARAVPRKIETEEQNTRYLAIVEKMIDKGAAKFSPEEDVLFDLLTTLIDEYEKKAYPMLQVEAHERIKYLLEEKGLKHKDLLPVLNSEGVISDVLSGKRPITLKTARKLAEFFNVPSELFI
jgi:HTH-type transcriptional regulator/antitoxin HigA